MQRANNVPPDGRQDIPDYWSFAESLQKGEVPPLNLLLALIPDDPLDLAFLVQDFDDFLPIRAPTTVRERALYKRFPGIRLDGWLYGKLKYVSPSKGAPLADWVFSVLHTAKSHWSGDVKSGQTQLQFKDWLPGYMERDDWFCRFGPRFDEAAQIVRLACGLTRFPGKRRMLQ